MKYLSYILAGVVLIGGFLLMRKKAQSGKTGSAKSPVQKSTGSTSGNIASAAKKVVPLLLKKEPTKLEAKTIVKKTVPFKFTVKPAGTYGKPVTKFESYGTKSLPGGLKVW